MIARARSAVAFQLLAATASLAAAQKPPARPPAAESTVVVIPEAGFEAGGFHRAMLGANYRDLWTMPIRVPVLDLRSFAGGLHAEKEGGGLQTKSLRFSAEDGGEYVFRTVHKEPHLVKPMAGAFATSVVRDQLSAVHPAAALMAAPLLEAAHVLHASPTLVVMPNDTLLGKFRADVAGKLGIIEEFPGKTGHGAGFAGAAEIIDSDSLLKLLNSNPAEHVDARAMLTARLMDLLLNDVDRHPGQWKWARMAPKDDPSSPWLPIPRDRDQAFVSYHGVFPSLIRKAVPNLVAFDAHPSVAGLTYNSREMDRRLLGALQRPVWDSVARALVRMVSDPVITAAGAAMPREYHITTQQMVATLRQRRDELPAIAAEFYDMVAKVADVHGTDAPERVRVTLVDDRFVDVRMTSASGTPFFEHRFDANETEEIRLHLHGGDDAAVVVGTVRRTIPLRIIGGSGTNRLEDSSIVNGRHGHASLYDQGKGPAVSYGPDTLFNRRPWIPHDGELELPTTDRGTRFQPVAGMSFPRDLGVVPRLGLRKIEYGYGRTPYASLFGGMAEYSTATGGFRFTANMDRRFEGTPFHFVATARMSQLDLMNFHGLGNDTPDSANGFFDLRQRQWMLAPAVAYSLGEWSDLTIGPVYRHTTTDSVPNRLVSTLNPYGSGTFSQAGLMVTLHHVADGPPKVPHRHFVLDVSGAYYPANLDAKSAYGQITARAGLALTVPLPTHPLFLVRAGGRKLYGDFPFFDAAVIGGNSTMRSMGLDRYAGDASVYASSELRVPVMTFSFAVPLEAGLVGVSEAGRVYVDGNSPGGWHTVQGGGIFIGRRDNTPSFMIIFTNEPGRTGLHFRTGLSF